jgi:hypothetical protein
MSVGDGDGGRVLTAAQLELLTAVEDRLIPREGDLPGAGESGAAERVDGLLAERREWRPDVLTALKAIEVAAERLRMERSLAGVGMTGAGFLGLSEDDRDAALRVVEAAQPRLFQRLLRITYTAYYTDPAVQRAGGFADAAPLPRGYEMETFDEARLEPVKRRGKLWRDTPA